MPAAAIAAKSRPDPSRRPGSRAVLVRAEGAVRDAADVQLLAVELEVPRADRGPGLYTSARQAQGGPKGVLIPRFAG